MSPQAVSTGTGNSASSGAHASSKASGTSADKAGKAGASQAPKGDVFAMLLMMLGDGPALAADAGLDLKEEAHPNEAAHTEDTPLGLTTAVGLTPTDTTPTAAVPADIDPVQAMLASRYPVDRIPTQTAMAGPEPLDVNSERMSGHNGSIDLTALGMQVTTDTKLPEDLTLPSDMKPVDTPATGRPTPGLSLSHNEFPPARAVRLAPGAQAATSQSTTRTVNEMTAQAAVTFASRSGEVVAWKGGFPMRSTVMLDARLSSLDTGAMSPVDGDLPEASRPAGGLQAQGSGHFGDPGQSMTDESVSMDAGRHDADNADLDHFAEAQAAAEDEAAELWHTGQLQQARLSIAGESGESIEVQLQLAGDSVNVEFRTDDENARQQLSQDGGRELSDRLEQEGLSLIDVSVGGRQGSGNPQGRPGNPSTVELGRASPLRRGGEAADTPVPGSQGLRPRADPGRPLDMFV